jgi:hypothetical protein
LRSAGGIALCSLGIVGPGMDAAMQGPLRASREHDAAAQFIKPTALRKS